MELLHYYAVRKAMLCYCLWLHSALSITLRLIALMHLFGRPSWNKTPIALSQIFSTKVRLKGIPNVKMDWSYSLYTPSKQEGRQVWLRNCFETASALFAVLFHLICWCLHPIVLVHWTLIQRITDFLKERSSILKPLIKEMFFSSLEIAAFSLYICEIK